MSYKPSSCHRFSNGGGNTANDDASLKKKKKRPLLSSVRLHLHLRRSSRSSSTHDAFPLCKSRHGQRKEFSKVTGARCKIQIQIQKTKWLSRIRLTHLTHARAKRSGFPAAVTVVIFKSTLSGLTITTIVSSASLFWDSRDGFGVRSPMAMATNGNCVWGVLIDNITLSHNSGPHENWRTGKLEKCKKKKKNYKDSQQKRTVKRCTVLQQSLPNQPYINTPRSTRIRLRHNFQEMGWGREGGIGGGGARARTHHRVRRRVSDTAVGSTRLPRTRGGLRAAEGWLGLDAELLWNKGRQSRYIQYFGDAV